MKTDHFVWGEGPVAVPPRTSFVCLSIKSKRSGQTGTQVLEFTQNLAGNLAGVPSLYKKSRRWYIDAHRESIRISQASENAGGMEGCNAESGWMIASLPVSIRQE
jgi:hypothetical protein